jgi:ADP-heptose:LPS heptosyltransferase
MKSKKLQSFIFNFSSRLTDLVPNIGAKFLDFLIFPIVGNSFIIRCFMNHNKKKIKKINKIERALIISDIHVGDAIMMQGAISAFKNCFPNAQIDYLIKKNIEVFFQGNPDISKIFPIFTGASLPIQSDLQQIQTLLHSQSYDICFNFCPFLDFKSLAPPQLPIFDIMTHSPYILQNEKTPVEPNHFMFHSYKFVYNILSSLKKPEKNIPFHGARIFLSEAATHQAKETFETLIPKNNVPNIFLNPDTASPFTRIPISQQAELIQQLSTLPCNILLGDSYPQPFLFQKIIAQLSDKIRNTIIMVPALPIDAYAAFLDFCDFFISGDTGPLHIAAAWKLPFQHAHPFKNRTRIFSLFGATPARMSGYDSSCIGFLPANQLAPSFTYISKSPCRNITCLNKMEKTCKTARCFESLDINHIVHTIQNELMNIKNTN